MLESRDFDARTVDFLTKRNFKAVSCLDVVARCLPEGTVAWRIYARPPHQVGEHTVKFCPNCVMLWERGTP